LDLQVKGYVGKEAFAADLTFWLLLGQAKSNSPTAIERQEPYTIRANRYAHAVSIGKSEICKVRGCFGIAKPLARQSLAMTGGGLQSSSRQLSGLHPS